MTPTPDTPHENEKHGIAGPGPTDASGTAAAGPAAPPEPAATDATASTTAGPAGSATPTPVPGSGSGVGLVKDVAAAVGLFRRVASDPAVTASLEPGVLIDVIARLQDAVNVGHAALMRAEVTAADTPTHDGTDATSQDGADTGGGGAAAGEGAGAAAAIEETGSVAADAGTDSAAATTSPAGDGTSTAGGGEGSYRVDRDMVQRVALARRMAPLAVGRELAHARILMTALPGLWDLTVQGVLDPAKARTAAGASSRLDDDAKTAFDHDLASDPGLFASAGTTRFTDMVKAAAIRAGDARATDRARTAARDRYLMLKTRADGMADVIIHAPAVEAVMLTDHLASLLTACPDQIPGYPESLDAALAHMHHYHHTDAPADGGTAATTGDGTTAAEDGTSHGTAADGGTAATTGDAASAAEHTPTAATGDSATSADAGTSSATSAGAASEATATGAAHGGGRVRPGRLVDALLAVVTGRVKPVSGYRTQVNLVMTDKTLLAGEGEPVRLEGYGIIPAPIARDIIDGTASTTRCVPNLPHGDWTLPEGGLIADWTSVTFPTTAETNAQSDTETDSGDKSETESGSGGETANEAGRGTEDPPGEVPYVSRILDPSYYRLMEGSGNG